MDHRNPGTTNRTSLDPFPRDKREITVGGKNAEYKTIGDALVAVRDRYRPARQGIDRLIVRIAEGVYQERIQIDSQSKPWPEGITLRGEGDVRIAPEGNDPVIRLVNVAGFAIENLRIDANEKPVAIELVNDLHESRLTRLHVQGFSQVGVLCKGAQGIPLENCQLLLDGLHFEPSGIVAKGIQFQAGTGNDANNIVIRGCRFLSPMAAGVLFEGHSLYKIDVIECLFNKTTDGLRFDGTPALKSIRVINNSFCETKSGIRFVSLPNELSSELSFRRNLFVKTQIAEVIVQQGWDDSLFRAMLSEGATGIENNWSDRAKPTNSIAGEISMIFENGGVQGNHDFALASTDANQAKFLAPTEKSPQRDVPGSQPTDRKWVGAIGP